MQSGKDFYTSREEAETLLKQTLEGADSQRNKRKDGEPVNKRARIFRRIVYILLIIAMLVMLGKVWYQKLNNETPSLFGFQIYVVETGSMVPTLPIGASILVRQLRDGDELKAGDIVTYSHNESAVTHRIIEVVTGEDGVTRYHTKGDNPDNSVDPWMVERGDIRGVVIWHFSLSRLLGR
ncbi:MAG: signal peptidase I [Bacillota bacterium]